MTQLNNTPALDAAHPERPTPADSLLRAAAWYQAMTLPERVVSLAAAGAACSNGGFDGARAEWRARRWRSQAPLADDALFARRLALDHIDTETFLLLLGEAPESLRDRAAAPPDWLAALLQAFDRQGE